MCKVFVTIGINLYHISLIRRFPIKLELRGGPRDLALQIGLIGYYNVSLIKQRCRASRRGEVFSPVGVRLPNPYENVRLCLEFAIYQTHVIIQNSR